jgi:hypothetical protein
MTTPTITNITCEEKSSRFVARFELGEFRYHVWLGQDGKFEDKILYKNPIDEKAHHNWRTRKLDALAISNRQLVRQLFTAIERDSLIEKARKKALDEQARLEAMAHRQHEFLISEIAQVIITSVQNYSLLTQAADAAAREIHKRWHGGM